MRCNFRRRSTPVCYEPLPLFHPPLLTGTDFGNGHKDAKGNDGIEPNLLGFINACYQLGSILAVPIAPWLAQRYGRRWSIMIGSLIQAAGAILQCFAQHGKSLSARMRERLLFY